MRPSTETPRSRRRRHTAPPTEASKEQHESEVASIETGLKLLKIYTSALEELKERGQSAAGDIKLALDFKHAPRDWSNAEILSVMADIIDEHPKPKLEFVLGVLGLSKLPDNLDDRLRSKGAKAYSSSVRNRALRRKKEAKEKEERERREKKEREERERREKKEREEKERIEKERREKERLDKERREKERLETEQREKERLEKERLEKEQREKEQREKKQREKKRHEKERLEKEKVEREKAEEEQKNAALKKDAESKRGGSKVRRGRRGRPPTRVVVTESAKNADADQAVTPVKVLMEQSQQKARDIDAMEVAANGVKSDAVAEKNSNTVAIPAGSSDGTEKTNSIMPPTPMEGVPPASPPHSEVKNAAQSMKPTQSKGKRTNGTPEEEQCPSRDGSKTGSKPTTLKKRAADQTESGSKEEQAKESIVKIERTKTQVDRNDKEPVTNIETREHPDASKAGLRHDEPKAVAHGKPEHVRDSDRMAHELILKAAPTRARPRAAEAQAQQTTAAQAPASNKVIAEAKIASALKESAAAVNREMPECQLAPSISLTPFSVLGEGSGADGLQDPGEREGAPIKESGDEKQTIELRAVGEVRVKIEDAKTTPKAAKVPTPRRPATRVPKESKTVDEKAKTIDSVEKTVDASKQRESNAEAPVGIPMGEQPTDIVKEQAKEEMKPQEDREQSCAGRREYVTSKDKVEEAKRDDETKGSHTEEKAKEPEQEAEDFMADVFGPEDGDGEKDDTEEGDAEKRGLRYRSRGRRSDDEDGETQALRDKESMFVESEDESESKQTRKRGRPTGVARRMSRRVSNIRDEIVIAPAGRRMRRESRNLINRAWQLPNTDQYLLECVEVWERLHGNRITIPFREPVTAKDAPGYFDIVKHPMDMRTVKDMLQDGRISSADEFYKQMKLICSNAFLFNDEDSDLYELASELLEMIRKDTRPIVKAWRESKGLEPEESESESEVESQRKRTKGRAKKKGKSKSKAKSKSTTEKRKRMREDDGGGKSKKRRTSRRTAKREEEE